MIDKNLNCYKVVVNTTNSSNNTFRGIGNYFECIDKTLFVITDDPSKIYLSFGKGSVISVEKIGIGYTL